MKGSRPVKDETKKRVPLREAITHSFSYAPRTIRLVFQSAPRGMAALFSLTIASALIPLAVAYVGKRIIDAVVAHNRHDAIHWVLVELACVALLAAGSQGLSLARQIVGARLGLDINLSILEKAVGLDLRHFEDPDYYDRLTKARREASSRPLSVVTRSFQILQNTVSLFGYAALLLRFSGWAVAALLLAAIPATVAEMRFSNKAFRLRNWRSPESRKLMYLEYVLANDEHAKEVKLYELGPLLLDRYRTLGESFYKDDRDLAVASARWAYGLSLLATGTFYACYASMAIAAVRGSLSLGDLTLGMVAFRQGQQSFQSLLGALGGMYEDNLYMSNLFGFLSSKNDAESEREKSNGAKSASILDENGIRFENVGFKYPGRDEWALRNIDVFIPAGQSLALVGQNGAGKTTFIKLLTRLYSPTEGRVLLDGKDLKDWNESELRRRVGVLFQDFAQYQFTARENVGMGSVQNLDDDAQITRAVGRGGADEVVAALKEGLQTPLGRWFSGGVELSGGQWQKLALSRAFMREDADILVLDEPTAALDAEAEHAVFVRFRELTKGKTSIVISHRFPTVKMADRILVIERGHVVEEGTHASLVEKKGRYQQLFALQAQGYLE
ncbi:MAG: ABC transporter ATP-binding protein [Polyangiaceae bacterium]